MGIDYKDIVDRCEEDVRGGQGQLVAQRLSAIRVSEIPREFVLPLANLCRRANFLPLGLKILSSTIRFHREGTHRATPGELAEYAVLLERSGAVKEALSILNQVDTTHAKDVHLFRAFCHFKSWDYAVAIPELESYIAAAATPYSQLIGNVNLAAALVIDGRFDPALDLLDRNVDFANQHGFTRLKGNCSELRAQVHVHRGDYAKARLQLEEAASIFSAEKTFDQFFVRKWQTITNAFETGDADLLTKLRAEALQRNDWETVREADLFRLKIRFDENEFDRLYFGTPFESYRRRVTSFLNRGPTRSHFLHGDSSGIVFDLATGEANVANHVNPGKLIHRTLSVLLRDLYRPLRIGGLFVEVFPEDHFDIYSSPGRVHQLLFRLREWIDVNQIPIELKEENTLYSITVNGAFAFKLSAESPEVGGWSPLWTKLRPTLNAAGSVTAGDVRSLLGLKESSCKRFLKWAVEAGHLERRGFNNRSSYVPTDATSKRSA